MEPHKNFMQKLGEMIKNRVFVKPSKWVFKKVKRHGKVRRIRVSRNYNKSKKTYLQKCHFGTFSPVKPFRY